MGRHLLLGLAMGCTSIGCAGRGNVDLLESRLRNQEDQLRETHAKLQSAQSELALAQRQTDELRERLAARKEPMVLPEQADALVRTAGVQINKLHTGGLDEDGQPGDEVLAASVAPVDARGELVRVPAAIELEVLDLALANEHQQIGLWKFGAEETPQFWHSGFLGSGYLFRLPWQQTPTNRDLLLHARLITADGRRFETSEPIRITPPASPSTSLARSAGSSSANAARTAPVGSPQPHVSHSAGDAKPVAASPPPAASRVVANQGRDSRKESSASPKSTTAPSDNLQQANWWDEPSRQQLH